MRLTKIILLLTFFAGGSAYGGLFADDSCNLAHAKTVYGSALAEESDVRECLDQFLMKLYAKHGFTCTKDNRDLKSFLDNTAGYYAVGSGEDLMYLARQHCIVKDRIANSTKTYKLPFKNRECNFIHDISALQIGRIHGLTKGETEKTLVCAKGILRKIYARGDYACEGAEHMNSYFDAMAPTLKTKGKSGLFETLMAYCVIDVRQKAEVGIWWGLLYRELFERLNALELPNHKLKQPLLRCTAASTVEFYEKKCKANDVNCIQRIDANTVTKKLLLECGETLK